MTASPKDLMEMSVGGRTVAENLKRALAAGHVIEGADGSLALAKKGGGTQGAWINVYNAPPLGCAFLNRFLFTYAYAGKAVPKGCELCYKVKVVPRTLRELVALYEIALATEGVAKFGIEFFNPFSQNFYAGYFYATGLPGARERYRRLREQVADHPKIGADIPMLIKRGCTNYEIECGPSDQYTFAPELEAIEANLKSRFRAPPPPQTSFPDLLFRSWVPYAFQIGDDTYLDFTNGRRLFPKTVSYDPQDS